MIISHGCDIVSISGGGDPLHNYEEHKDWYEELSLILESMGIPMEMHTSYVKNDFPTNECKRVVYHLHDSRQLRQVRRKGNEIVRVVFVITKNMTESDLRIISDYIKEDGDIDELSFRQQVGEDYKTIFHLHNVLLAGHKYEKIEKLMAEADINVTTFFGKTTVVAAQFPNGFVITESSSCVDPRAYDEEEGKQICLKRIKERLWEMEGYFLQEQEYLWKESYDTVVKSENKKMEMEKVKNEVTQEIARAAHKDLMATFKKEYERDESSNLEEAYYKRMEEMSREFNVEQKELAKGIAEISVENIYREFMNRFFGIAL